MVETWSSVLPSNEVELVSQSIEELQAENQNLKSVLKSLQLDQRKVFNYPPSGDQGGHEINIRVNALHDDTDNFIRKSLAKQRSLLDRGVIDPARLKMDDIASSVELTFISIIQSIAINYVVCQ
jgi:hypothetical protein